MLFRSAAIFQDPLTSLNPLFTVGRQLTDTIQTHLSLTYSQSRQRAVELLARTGIPAPELRIDHYPHQFSGGMRQRVVIALALAAEPKLIIADEPTTALDVSIQAQIIRLLKQVSRDLGTSIMLITHDMGVIAETADRVAVMYAGRVAEIGAVDAMIHRPKHPYTKGLMASIPSIRAHRDRLAQIEGAMPRLDAIPKGCAFNPRCSESFSRCQTERPELQRAGERVELLGEEPGDEQAERPRHARGVVERVHHLLVRVLAVGVLERRRHLRQRRIDLGVAMIAGVHIEKKLSQRTFEPRQRSFQHHEPRA